MSVKLHKSIEHFTIDESLLFQCLEGVAEIIDEVSVLPFLLNRAQFRDETAAEKVVQ